VWEVGSLQEARRLVLGATVLGTGGGGDPERGLEMMREVLDAGLKVRVVSVDELDEGALVVQPYFVGSIAPGLKRRKPVRFEDAIGRAVRELESLLGKKVGAVVATELGGSNTPAALSIAAKLGVPAVDGDLMGRAGPELHQCTTHVFGIPMTPSAMVTPTGDVVVVKEYADIDDYEAIARYLSTLDGECVGVVDAPMGKAEASKAVVKGTISLCMRVGEAIEKARESGEDPVRAAAEAMSGWVVFEGKVVKYDWRNEGGFLKGEAVVKGSGRFEGRELKSWIMNEHIMAWLDGEPLIMPPDLMAFLRPDGEPITNTILKVGDEVRVIAAKAPEVWRTPEGLKYFGPRHFGFDYDYVPVEELLRKHGLI